jgi:hypothetical protein
MIKIVAFSGEMVRVGGQGQASRNGRARNYEYEELILLWFY